MNCIFIQKVNYFPLTLIAYSLSYFKIFFKITCRQNSAFETHTKSELTLKRREYLFLTSKINDRWLWSCLGINETSRKLAPQRHWMPQVTATFRQPLHCLFSVPVDIYLGMISVTFLQASDTFPCVEYYFRCFRDLG